MFYSNSCILSFLDDEKSKNSDSEGEDDGVTLGSHDTPSVSSVQLDEPLAPVKMVSVAGRGSVSLAHSVVPATSGDPGNWNPLYLKSLYTDGRMQQHQVIIVLLPGGVGYKESKDMELSLVTNYHGKQSLKVTVEWPEWIRSHAFLDRLKTSLKEEAMNYWHTQEGEVMEQLRELHIENTTLLSHSIKQQLVSMRTQSDNSLLKAETTIPLDMAVRPITDSDWHFCGNSEGVRILFVDLKAPLATSYERSKSKTVALDF